MSGGDPVAPAASFDYEAKRWGAGPLRPRIAALPLYWRWGLYYAGAAGMLALATTGDPFIYFRF